MWLRRAVWNLFFYCVCFWPSYYFPTPSLPPSQTYQKIVINKTLAPPTIRKHEMKHTRPFICHQSNCPKHTIGFTTSNDLRRHMKALHGYRYKSSSSSCSSASGDGGGGGWYWCDGGGGADGGEPATTVGGWRCKYCPPVEVLWSGGGSGSSTTTITTTAASAVTKAFFSTRKDNFRNHIKRIHNGLRRESESIDEFFRR